MRKSLKFVSAAIFLSVSLSSFAFESPSSVTVDLNCPLPFSGGPEALTNFGDKIAGYGNEMVNGSPSMNQPYFIGKIDQNASIPADLFSYQPTDTSYDSTTGVIGCHFESMEPDNEPFAVYYKLTNGLGGQVMSQGPENISIMVPFGFK